MPWYKVYVRHRGRVEILNTQDPHEFVTMLILAVIVQPAISVVPFTSWSYRAN